MTDAARMAAVLEAIGQLRSVALDVSHSDHEGWAAETQLMPRWRRKRSWLRILAYCAKVSRPGPGLRLPSGWSFVMKDVSAEPGFRSWTCDDAVAARAAHAVNACKGLFCRRDRKVKVLTPWRPKPQRTPKPGGVRREGIGRPCAELDPAILEQVREGRMSKTAAAALLGVDRKTVRRHL